MSPMPKNRKEQIVKRWVDVTAYGVVAGLFYLVVLLWMIPGYCFWAGDWVTKYPFEVLCPVVVFAVLLYAIYNRKRLPQIVGLNFVFSYPPLWVAVLIALAILSITASNCHFFKDSLNDASPAWLRPDMHKFLSLWFYIFIGISILLLPIALIRSFFRYSRFCSKGSAESQQSEPNAIGLVELSANPEALLNWIKDDAPITCPADDMAEHWSIARNIADRYSIEKTESPQGVALIGDLGSGKSSIVKLVEYEFQKRAVLQKNIVVSTVSIWNYLTPQAAVSAVLKQLLCDIREQIAPVTMRGIPEKYLAAIRGVSKDAGKFAQLYTAMRPDLQSPGEVLETCNSLLLATNLRVLLVVEDIERFLPRGDHSDLSENRVMAPISALLYELDKQSNIHVMLSTTSRVTKHIEVMKHVGSQEIIPTLKPIDILNIVSSFYICQTEAGDYNDPADPKTVRKHFHDEDVNLLVYKAAKKDKIVHPERAICVLLSSPRSLKYALRYCKEKWDRLKGEVDFDDLFVISVIQAVNANILQYVLENQKLFTNPVSISPTANTKHIEAKDKILSDFRSYLLALSENSPNGFSEDQILAMVKLIEFLYPALGISRIGEQQKPQSVAFSRHTNYLERINRGRLLESDTPDQRVIKEMKNWDERKISRFPEMVIGAPVGTQFIPFLNSISFERMVDFVVETLGMLKSNKTTMEVQERGLKKAFLLLYERGSYSNSDETLAPFERALRNLLSEKHPLTHVFLLNLIDTDREASVSNRFKTKLLTIFFQEIREFLEEPESAVDFFRGLSAGVTREIIQANNRYMSEQSDGIAVYAHLLLKVAAFEFTPHLSGLLAQLFCLTGKKHQSLNGVQYNTEVICEIDEQTVKLVGVDALKKIIQTNPKIVPDRDEFGSREAFEFLKEKLFSSENNGDLVQ